MISRTIRWFLQNGPLPFAFTIAQRQVAKRSRVGNTGKIEIRANKRQSDERSGVRKEKPRIEGAFEGIASSRSNIFCWLLPRGPWRTTENPNEKKSLNQMMRKKDPWRRKEKEKRRTEWTGRKAFWNFKLLRKEWPIRGRDEHARGESGANKKFCKFEWWF